MENCRWAGPGTRSQNHPGVRCSARPCPPASPPPAGPLSAAARAALDAQAGSNLQKHRGLRPENPFHPGGGGCGEPRGRHRTPAWAKRAKLRLKKKKKTWPKPGSCAMAPRPLFSRPVSGRFPSEAPWLPQAEERAGRVGAASSEALGPLCSPAIPRAGLTRGLPAEVPAVEAAGCENRRRTLGAQRPRPPPRGETSTAAAFPQPKALFLGWLQPHMCPASFQVSGQCDVSRSEGATFSCRE
nr:translation initiation factor IF-2-like isoform X2 [Gorilla gorilla gorilla]